MQKKTCPNGHVYDPSIYGDQCPMCPKPGAQASYDGHTHIANPQPSFNSQPGFNPQQQAFDSGQQVGFGAQQGPAGRTKMMPNGSQPAFGDGQGAAQAGGHTVIRRPGQAGGAAATGSVRKLVGFLVTYNRDPMGKAYNIYEGRNYVGRDANCDISIPDDPQMSSRHMSILYRSVDNKFKFRDEQSSNGTFVNKELLDDGELENYDIIRVGSTLFIFIAIPKIG